MKKLSFVVPWFAVILTLSTLYFFLSRPAPSPDPRNTNADESAPILSGATAEALADIRSYEYTQTYVNSAFGFSFRHPQGFTVTAAPGTGADGEAALLVESGDKKVGIQIVISPYGADVDITAALIRADLPNVQIDNPQAVEIGSHRLGLAFMSDNPAFCAPPEPCAEGGGGRSREVWFVFKGNLYQISTYAEFDEFLKGLFDTWQFTR